VGVDEDLAGWAGELRLAGVNPGQVERICSLCVDRLDVSGGGVSMMTVVGNRAVVCATDDTAAAIEEMQFTLGEGPCLDAVARSRPVLVADLSLAGDHTPDRWPAFTAQAVAAGVGAIFAFPLLVGRVSVGALGLYRHLPGDLSRPELVRGLLAADAVASALVDLDPNRSGAFTDDTAMRASYQMQVHQASGMVQVQLGVTIDDAYRILKARAYASDRTVAEVARDVVERRLRFSAGDDT
jgi:GAF domain/ANTAR domain